MFTGFGGAIYILYQTFTRWRYEDGRLFFLLILIGFILDCTVFRLSDPQDSPED